jgi:hypothetical protein
MGSTQLVDRGGGEVVGILFLWVGHFGSNANESMAIIRNMFPGHLVSRFGDVPWPPCSPDLSKCDFFLWGYFKSRVYPHKPRTLKDLKKIRPIDRLLLARVVDDLKKRLENCIQEDGRHLTISFLKLNHPVWHVLSFNFV